MVSALHDSDQSYALVFRPMAEADVAAVHKIESLSYQFPWSAKIFRDCLQAGYSCWVVEKNDEIVGYGLVSAAAGEAHLLNICLTPAERGGGIARKFLKRLLMAARWHRAESLFLEVRPSNEAACHLYRSEGFVEVGARKNYYPAGDGREDALIMRYDFS